MLPWHSLSIAEVAAALDVDPERGLSAEEAAKRLEQHGPNQLTEAHRISPWALLLGQLKNVLIVILLLSAVLSAFLGHEVEAIAIGVIVLFAVLLGFVQEYRAEKAIDALKKLAAPTATVLRDGTEQDIPAHEVVPGDIVLLTAGDRIPADGRLLAAVSLQCEESSLTGESVPTHKTVEPIEAEDVTVGDRSNMVFAATAATYGRGRMLVTETAMRTEVGNIAGMLEAVESTATPLQKRLDKVGHALAKAAFAVVAVIGVLGYLRGQPLLEVLIFGIALAVAVVPEALPAVVTISLAIGVQKMVRRHALIRRLPAVETLGSVTVICTDKTGTLTRDEMTLTRLVTASGRWDVSGSGYAPEGTFLREGNAMQPDALVLELLRAGTLSSDARMVRDEGRWDIAGDPTEGGLVVAAAKAALIKEELDRAHPRTGEIPFSSETKRMTTLHGDTAYAKGAFEVILGSCETLLTADGVRALTDSDRAEIMASAQDMADGALRVLALARKTNAALADAETGMTFLGLAGMIDPPREEAKEAVATCKQAGIKVMMITGDHPATARAIAKELRILEHGKVVTGPDLEAMTDAHLAREVGHIEVCARVSPAHKLRVVTALQAHGHVVAMTGDGVNDAPALKKADIGIAMGITGTDVSKEAAAMTLTDDNFASIVAAVEEGRAIFSNITTYLTYLLSSNIGEICIMTGSALLGLPLPLSAVQILYINLATDGLPALALAVDPPEKNLMRRPPRDPRRSIFTRGVVTLMLAGGLWSMVVNLGLFAWALSRGLPLPHAMTLTFACLVCIEFFKAYVFSRSLRNKWLHLAIAWEVLLMLLILYVPLLRTVFQTTPLGLQDWAVILPAAASVVPVLEGVKIFLAKNKKLVQ